mmetsp:Transcript_32344/g.77622  ORF Transcript_32344/g.77622 Transcript_32344/m.77622 type:complete len:202 (+) Transcript_32344:480-1085(+)
MNPATNAKTNTIAAPATLPCCFAASGRISPAAFPRGIDPNRSPVLNTNKPRRTATIPPAIRRHCGSGSLIRRYWTANRNMVSGTTARRDSIACRTGNSSHQSKSSSASTSSTRVSSWNSCAVVSLRRRSNPVALPTGAIPTGCKTLMMQLSAITVNTGKRLASVTMPKPSRSVAVSRLMMTLVPLADLPITSGAAAVSRAL